MRRPLTSCCLFCHGAGNSATSIWVLKQWLLFRGVSSISQNQAKYSDVALEAATKYQQPWNLPQDIFYQQEKEHLENNEDEDEKYLDSFGEDVFKKEILLNHEKEVLHQEEVNGHEDDLKRTYFHCELPPLTNPLFFSSNFTTATQQESRKPQKEYFTAPYPKITPSTETALLVPPSNALEIDKLLDFFLLEKKNKELKKDHFPIDSTLKQAVQIFAFAFFRKTPQTELKKAFLQPDLTKSKLSALEETTSVQSNRSANSVDLNTSMDSLMLDWESIVKNLKENSKLIINQLIALVELFASRGIPRESDTLLKWIQEQNSKVVIPIQTLELLMKSHLVAFENIGMRNTKVNNVTKSSKFIKGRPGQRATSHLQSSMHYFMKLKNGRQHASFGVEVTLLALWLFYRLQTIRTASLRHYPLKENFSFADSLLTEAHSMGHTPDVLLTTLYHSIILSKWLPSTLVTFLRQSPIKPNTDMHPPLPDVPLGSLLTTLPLTTPIINPSPETETKSMDPGPSPGAGIVRLSLRSLSLANTINGDDEKIPGTITSFKNQGEAALMALQESVERDCGMAALLKASKTLATLESLNSNTNKPDTRSRTLSQSLSMLILKWKELLVNRLNETLNRSGSRTDERVCEAQPLIQTLCTHLGVDKVAMATLSLLVSQRQRGIWVPQFGAFIYSRFVLELGNRLMEALGCGSTASIGPGISGWPESTKILVGGRLLADALSVCILEDGHPAFIHSIRRFRQDLRLGLVSIHPLFLNRLVGILDTTNANGSSIGAKIVTRMDTDTAMETGPLTPESAAETSHSWIDPLSLPMVVPPRLWSSWHAGGYLTRRFPCFRVRDDPLQVAQVQLADSKGTLQTLLTGLDLLGRTPWRINLRVLQVVQAFWDALPTPTSFNQDSANCPHSSATTTTSTNPAIKSPLHSQLASMLFSLDTLTKETDRHSFTCDVFYKLLIANELKHRDFYLPHNVDFRGRAYPIPALLSHMGSDLCRGLVLFGEGAPLGSRGLYWLSVHLANVFGHDKCSFDDRVAWVNAHRTEIIASAANPMGIWDSKCDNIVVNNTTDNTFDDVSELHGSLDGFPITQSIGNSSIIVMENGSIGDILKANPEANSISNSISSPITNTGANPYNFDTSHIAQTTHLPHASLAPWWTTAEDPWQTLATCIELANAWTHPQGPEAYVTSLPVQQDGSCNGLQHYAALGRDTLGALHVNLAPGDGPADVYSAVAEIVSCRIVADAAQKQPSSSNEGNVTIDSVNAELPILEQNIASNPDITSSSLNDIRHKPDNAEIARWILSPASGLPLSTTTIISRKIIKQSVMTSVYGVTLYGASQQVYKRLVEIVGPKAPAEPERLRQAARYIAGLALNSLGSMFDRSRRIQAWLTEAVSQVTSSVSREWAERYHSRIEGDNGHSIPFPMTQLPHRSFSGPLEELFRQSSLWTRSPLPLLDKLDAEEDFYPRTLMSWTSPLGFPISQPYRQPQLIQVQTLLQLVVLKVAQETPSKVAIRRQIAAFAPNFIHSLDASHMFMTAQRVATKKITFASVHDSYWTHPKDVDVLHQELRAAFVELHSRPLLEELRMELMQRFGSSLIPVQVPKSLVNQTEITTTPTIEKEIPCVLSKKKKSSNHLQPRKKEKPVLAWAPVSIPPVPEPGTFQLEDVLRSPYFFS